MVDAVRPFCQNTGFELRRKPISYVAAKLAISVPRGTASGHAPYHQNEQIRRLSVMHGSLLNLYRRTNSPLPARASI